MARIRYLKPEFFTDEDLGNLPFQTRLTFAGLWVHADKAGRLEYRPKYLKAMIFPYDTVKIEKEIEMLSTGKSNGIPFIQLYNIENRQFIQIIHWDKHQRPHHTEKESEIPPAPPLNTKGMEKGNQLEGSTELRNGELTVKEPLNKVYDKNKYGQFENVLLTISEKEKVSLNEIESLSEYLASHGKKYKSHYATILSWRRKNGSVLPQTNSTKEIFTKCPKCGKETTKEDLRNFESCPSCFKPIPAEKISELISKIGENTK